MTCPECEATRKQYLAMRRAVLGFARMLNQYEQERLTELDDYRPAGAPSMRELTTAIEREAGLTLHDRPPVRRVGS